MYRRGTIVLVPFPFTDLSGNKVRPAVIISVGKVGGDVVVLFLTSQAKSKGLSLVSVTPTPENGLKVASKIVCTKIATLDSKVVLGELGTLSEITLAEVDAQLRNVLGL